MAIGARVLGEKLLHDGRFRLTRTHVEIDEADGTRRELDHEVYHYKRAAAVLLYDPARSVVFLVSQFRLGAFLDDGALDLLEVCAGMLDGDAPEECARREAVEEAGIRIGELRLAFETFTSPGGMTEKLYCFVAPYSPADRIGEGGGVDHDEHIDLVEMPVADALAGVANGRIRDVKTIALLYYARATGLI